MLFRPIQWCQLSRKVWSQRQSTELEPPSTNQAVPSLLVTYRAICSKAMITRIGLALPTKWTMSLDQLWMSSVQMRWKWVDKRAHHQYFPHLVQRRLSLTRLTLTANPWPPPSRYWKLCSVQRLFQRSNPSAQIFSQSSAAGRKLGL